MELGGFDPNIFLFYEDDDLCRRIIEAGHALVHVHAAVARHERGKSSLPRPGRAHRARWHLAWSRAYVARKWGLPEPALATLLQNAPKVLLSTLARNKGRAERYRGSMDGALAWLLGKSALDREGLDSR
jgi:GT2 family glycosyltransferase